MRRWPAPQGNPFRGSSPYQAAANCVEYPKSSGYAGCMPVPKHGYPKATRPAASPASATFPLCVHNASLGRRVCNQRLPASIQPAAGYTKLVELLGAPSYSILKTASGAATDMVAYATNAKVADLDGNGSPDIIFVAYEGFKQVWTNDGSANFALKSNAINLNGNAIHTSPKGYGSEYSTAGVGHGNLDITWRSPCYFLNWLELGDLDGSQHARSSTREDDSHATRAPRDALPRAPCHCEMPLRGEPASIWLMSSWCACSSR